MHSISFVLNIPDFSLLSACLQMHLPQGLAPSKHTDIQTPDSHIKNCFKNFCPFPSDYTIAYLEGQVVMRKNSLVLCILILSTEFNSEMHLLQRVLANSPEENLKALLICKELKKSSHIDNIFFSSDGKHKHREHNQ